MQVQVRQQAVGPGTTGPAGAGEKGGPPALVRREVAVSRLGPARWHLRPLGAFDLGHSVRFGFGHHEGRDAPVMRLGFVLDGYREQVGAAVSQQPDGGLDVKVAGGPDDERAVRQVARVLSVDVDARAWDELSRRDPLLGRLQAGRPGLRPPLFHSAYEGLVWAVLAARRPRAQAAVLRERLATEHGAVLEVAGRPMPVLPTPERLLGVGSVPGLPAVALRRLHGIAGAALDGGLDTDTLRALDPAVAAAQLRRLEGVGPFSAELVTVRALGHTDVVPTAEPTVRRVAARVLGRPEPLSQPELEELALPWRPWRTWATVALRAVGPELAVPAPLPG